MHIELYEDREDLWRFRVVADNEEIFNDNYRDRTDAKRGALDLYMAIALDFQERVAAGDFVLIKGAETTGKFNGRAIGFVVAEHVDGDDYGGLFR